jgi:hypothetical protein
MFYQWIKFNFTILIYKITNRKHDMGDAYRYTFRNYESYKYKIEYNKDPFDYFDIDLWDKLGLHKDNNEW